MYVCMYACVCVCVCVCMYDEPLCEKIVNTQFEVHVKYGAYWSDMKSKFGPQSKIQQHNVVNIHSVLSYGHNSTSGVVNIRQITIHYRK
jgi:hypothetical protein